MTRRGASSCSSRTAHVAADAVDYFQLPRKQTVLLGSAIDV